MKLWYQSMSRQTEWGGYPAVLRGILDKVKDPGTEIHAHGITKIGGTGDQYRYLEYLETGEVLENVHKAQREGYDAFLIGNIADPGLREAREIADIPVLGLCESALHMACMMGSNFSLVTINEKFTPRIVENVYRYGLRDRFAAVNRMQVDRLTDLGSAFEPGPACPGGLVAHHLPEMFFMGRLSFEKSGDRNRNPAAGTSPLPDARRSNTVAVTKPPDYAVVAGPSHQRT